MSSNRGWKLLPLVGMSFLLAACAQMGGATSSADGAAIAKPAGGACQSTDGPVADGTIVAKCAVPGQGVTDCPRYLCRRCNGGTWGGEYTCRLR